MVASVDCKRSEILKAAVVTGVANWVKGTGGLDRVGLASFRRTTIVLCVRKPMCDYVCERWRGREKRGTGER